MGTYTEIIFGASLKKDTPPQVINALQYMIGTRKDKPEDFPLPIGRCEYVLRGTSYYFGVIGSVSQMRFDKISDSWTISTRSNIKNYNQEIETFLAWIKPYIAYASGERNMYAVVLCEHDTEPTIYYLNEC